MLVQALLDPWDNVGRMIGDSKQMRAVGFLGTMNPDFKIGDYCRDIDGVSRLNVNYVLSLVGGGPSVTSSSNSSKQRNALAGLLLNSGCDFGHVATFVDALVNNAGPIAVDAALAAKNVKGKWDNVTKLAKSLNIAIPEIDVAAPVRRAKIQERIQKPAREMVESFNLDGITIKEGFFLNNDGTSCKQIKDIYPKPAGVAILDQYRSRSTIWGTNPRI